MQALAKKDQLQKGAALLLAAAALFWIGFCWGTGSAEVPLKATLRGFTLILWSILLEALPFVLLGTLISSLIQVFVSEEMILRVLPRNHFLRLVTAGLVGLVFPVCECAIVPITRGLIKKGLPVGPAVAFMIATPILNPVVLLSTYNAFSATPRMVAYRAAGGFIGAIVIGLLAGRFQGKSVLKPGEPGECACGHDHEAYSHEPGCACGHGHETHSHEPECACGHTHTDPHGDAGKAGWLREVVAHTGAELHSVGAYLIFGAIIAAAMQMAVPKSVLAGIGGGRITSILVMMGLAFALSLCSEADAFVANTFMLHFSGASVLAFLLTGPMIDIKNTMMLSSAFKKRFVFRLIAAILAVCFLLALAASLLMGNG